MFSKSKIFSVENILCKGKHFLLFDCVVEITPENYFLCLVLDVKNLFLENVSPSQASATTIKDKHNQSPSTQNPNWEEGKNHHHCSATTTTKNPPPSTQNPPKHHHPYQTKTTTHTTTTTTKSKIKQNENQT